MYVHTVNELCRPNKMYMHTVSAENKVYFIDLHNLRDTMLVRLPPSYVYPSTSNIDTSVRFCLSDYIADRFRLLEENAIAPLHNTTARVDIRKDEDYNSITARCDEDVKVYDSFGNPIGLFDINSLHNTFIEPILAIHGFVFDNTTRCIFFDYQLVQVCTCVINAPTIHPDVKHTNLFQLKD